MGIYFDFAVAVLGLIAVLYALWKTATRYKHATGCLMLLLPLVALIVVLLVELARLVGWGTLLMLFGITVGVLTWGIVGTHLAMSKSKQ